MRGRAVRIAVLSVACLSCSGEPTGVDPSAEANAGHWTTWVLASGTAVRPAAPPAAGSSTAASEIDEILRAQGGGGAALSNDVVKRWSGSPTAVWDSVALDRLDFYWPLLPDVRMATPVRAARVMALLNVAMYDALVATWDAKYAYNRPSPADADKRVRALVSSGGVPSYPSEHAAVAAAAAAVLAYAIPTADTAQFFSLASQVGSARIALGVNYRSDIDAGYAIGSAVAARALARARDDGSAAPWTGSTPVGPTYWRPTPPKNVKVPFDPTAGNWRTWVIASGATFRPAPPPMPGSPVFETSINELRRLSTTRTVAQADLARHWATDAPSTAWERYAADEVARHQLGTLHDARARALISVAMYDAFVACWDTKFTYWLARPVTMDSTIVTVFSTPPFPSYPSGHSTISTAASEVFAALFPDVAQKYRDLAAEASESRVIGGVHYRFDVDTGDALGAKVGRAVADYAKSVMRDQ